MASTVFANNMEVSCKAASGKTICAFPDVCFTPPETPVTPPGVPIPYPNTGMASDTTDGSKKVKIDGKEVGLKDKSNFKKSTGDEAGCAAKKGVVTSKNTGKVYFQSWSMDVKIEGENAVRHLDLTTNNHASKPGDTPPWMYADSQAMSSDSKCKEDRKNERDACEHLEVKSLKANKKTGLIETHIDAAATKTRQCADEDCQKARKCMLVPYGKSGSPNCCPGDQAHHLVEVHGFQFVREAESAIAAPHSGVPLLGTRETSRSKLKKSGYDLNKAPCVCASGPKTGPGEHADLHSVQGALELGAMANAGPGHKNLAWTYGESRDAGITSHKAVFPDSKCSDACLKEQLDSYHKNEVGTDEDTPMRTIDPGLKKDTHQLARGLELLTELAKGVKKATGLIFPG